jgi:hypothetical protein
VAIAKAPNRLLRGKLAPPACVFAIAAALFVSTCVRPADERSDDEYEVGIAEMAGLSVDVVDGQAAVRELSQGKLMLWAQAPQVEIRLQSDEAQALRLELRNCMPGAELTLGETRMAATAKPHATWCVYDLDLPAGESTVLVAPPDWQDEARFRFADMGDIQTAMGSVHEVFEAISRTPDLRFVMSTGDVVEKGEIWEYQLFQEKLLSLDIPFYSTIGNHELTQNIHRWRTRFGRYSVHFRFKGVDFSYVDSGNASIDPRLQEQLQGWLDQGQDRVHIFGTHYPLFDPVGVRNAGFRSRNEASKLLVKLATGKVDLTLYGHVHSLYEFENASIPAYISGGGGALPERFDGIDRHFLIVEVDPGENRVVSVDVSRI